MKPKKDSLKSNLTEVESIVKPSYKQLYANKTSDLDKVDKFVE